MLGGHDLSIIPNGLVLLGGLLHWRNEEIAPVDIWEETERTRDGNLCKIRRFYMEGATSSGVGRQAEDICRFLNDMETGLSYERHFRPVYKWTIQGMEPAGPKSDQNDGPWIQGWDVLYGLEIHPKSKYWRI